MAGVSISLGEKRQERAREQRKEKRRASPLSPPPLCLIRTPPSPVRHAQTPVRPGPQLPFWQRPHRRVQLPTFSSRAGSELCRSELCARRHRSLILRALLRPRSLPSSPINAPVPALAPDMLLPRPARLLVSGPPPRPGRSAHRLHCASHPARGPWACATHHNRTSCHLSTLAGLRGAAGPTSSRLLLTPSSPPRGPVGAIRLHRWCSPDRVRASAMHSLPFSHSILWTPLRSQFTLRVSPLHFTSAACPTPWTPTRSLASLLSKAYRILPATSHGVARNSPRTLRRNLTLS